MTAEAAPRKKTGEELVGESVHDTWRKIRVGTAEANAAHKGAREDGHEEYDRWFDRVDG